MKHITTKVKGLMVLLCAMLLSANSFGQLKISQVYGGGGNAGATYKNDFIEIFNPTSSPVVMSNWAVQYASSGGTSWTPVSISGTIPAGKYYLIAMASGGGVGATLPTADATGSSNMSATAGKVALTNTNTALSGACPTGGAIVDFVGFGTGTSCSEGSLGPAGSNPNSIFRLNGGCTDANNNSADFVSAVAVARNSASPANSCTVPPTATTNAATVTSAIAATLNGTVNANGTSTAISFEYGLTVGYGSTVAGTPSPLTTSVATAVSAAVSGLAVNTQYNFRVVATAGTTVNGSNATFYTFANVPNAPTVVNPTTSSLDVTIGGSDGNPSTTEYAIQETGSTNYVQAGGTLGASAVWQTLTAWGTKTVTGLSSNTSYTFQVKARNGASVETGFGTTASGTTTALGTPTITVTASITPFSTVSGTPSASQQYTVSGSALTNDIVLTPTSNFEISLDNTNWVNSTSNITLALTSGVVNTTTIYVHFVSGVAGTFSGSVGHTTAGGATQTLSLSGTALATEPNTASNVTFGATSATTMTINFSGGSGASRIVVLKAGSVVGFVPSDGSAVAGVNSNFSAATNQGGNGDRIVYDGTGNTVNVTDLTASTTYNVAVYEYNGSVVTANYFTTAGIGINATLIAEPTLASTLTFGTVTTSSMILNFTGGNGASRIVVAHENSAVTFTPSDLTVYTGVNSIFTSASDQGSGNKIVYDGTGTTVTVTGLTQGTEYYYVVYEYNGSGATANYLQSPFGSGSSATVGPWPYNVTGGIYSQNFNGLPTSGSFSTLTTPTYISTSPISATSMVGWQIGSTFGATKLFAGDGSSITSGGGNYNLGTGAATERALGSFASTSFFPSMGIVLKNTTTDVLTNVTITFTGEQWRRGDGAANVLSFKYSVGGSDLSTGTFTTEPILNFTSPITTGANVGLDGNVAPNRTAVSASFVLNSNWIPGQTLVLRWDDANDAGNDDILAIDDFTFVATPPSRPTIQDNNISFSNVLTTSLSASWINGDGLNHLVKINTSNSFTDPADGYISSPNPVFANAGEQDVYTGTGSSVNISGLSPNTQYYVRVYGFNGSGSGSKYLTTTATLNPNNTTTAAPSIPTKVVVLDVNGGLNVTVNQPFSVTVQAQDNAGSPQSVTQNTTIDLSVYNGFGNLYGIISGDILAGTNTLVISGVQYDLAENNVRLDASASVGDVLTNNQSAFFNVVDVATNLVFSTTPANGIANATLSNIVVQARRPNTTVDPTYSGAITLSVSSGPGSISGTVTVNAVNGIATFTNIQLSAPGTYTLEATDGILTPGTSPSILITAAPTLTELVIPQFIGCKTTASSNNDRTPIAICIQIDNLIPNTAYDLRAGIEDVAVATGYGGGNLWTGAGFSGSSITNAFTTNALGSSGPVWFFSQPATSRFEPGIQHNIRIGYIANGSTLPTAPNFIGSKTITALDIPSTARTSGTTADDGAFLKGTASTCLSGKYVLIYNNEAGTGDPLYSYQIRTSVPTAGSISGLPTSVGDVFAQSGTSGIGDYAAVIPIGANNTNGVRRIEARNSQNAIVSFQTDPDGIWPGGANTTTITRRGVSVLTLSDAPLNTLSVTTSTTPATCAGTNDGTATANATGTGTLTYSWNTSPVQTTSIATGLASGTYIVTVSDGSGCSATASAVVGQPAASTITAGGPTTFCSPGTVTLTAGLGASYLWSTGATTQAIVASSTGNYSVTVDNGAGCIQTSLPTVVTANNFTFSGVLYSENMGTPSGTTALASNVFQNSSPITYTSTSSPVTDARSTTSSTGPGASGGGNIYFGNAGARNFIISGINTQGASGMVLTFYLKRDLNVSDPMILESSTDGSSWNTMPFTNPTGTAWTQITINTGIPAASNLRLRFSKASTTATFRLDDVIITSSASSVIASASGSTILCPGASVTLTSNIPSSNTWTPGGATTRSITVNTAASYTVTAIGSNGCPGTSAPVVVQNVTAPVVVVTSSNVLCSGGTSGSASTSVTDGTSPFTYSWSTSPIQTTSSASSLSAGNYSVVVTDANGCTGSQSTTITQPTVLTGSASITTPISCNGGSASVSVTASGGTAPYTGTGTYSELEGSPSYSITDANGCATTASVTITQPIVLSASSSATPIACSGGTSSVTVSASGGTSPYTGTGVFSELAGSPSYLVTDANGCTANTSVTISQPSAIVVTATETSSIVCPGGTATITVGATGGTGAYTGTGTFTVSAGTHNYTVTDANGCLGSTSIVVSNPAAVTLSSFTPESGCVGSTVTILGSNLNLVTAIDLNGISATFVIENPGEITVTIPPAATNGVFNLYTAANCTTSASSSFTVTNCSAGMTVDLNLFLEGYYTGSGTMVPALMNEWVVGATSDQTDTITVDLWTWDGVTAGGQVFADSAKAILMTDGTATATFTTAPAGNYYIGIRHRSSVLTWSSAEVTMGSTPASYNFATGTSGISEAYGDNMSDKFNESIYSIYCGDLNHDDYVDIFDYNNLDLDTYNFAGEDYYATDLNGDGYVDIFDYNDIDRNTFNFVGSIHP